MRLYKTLVLSLTILLSSCASTNQNYYQMRVNSWRGTSINTLVKRWGTPHERINRPDGGALLVYRSQSLQSYTNPASPQLGVNVSGRRPIIVVNPQENPQMRTSILTTCYTSFTTNSQWIVTDAKVEGAGCNTSDLPSRGN